MDALAIIVATLFIALIINIVIKKMHMPVIIGYILTGVIVAYGFKLQSNHDLMQIAEFGIVFLMFSIGLEFSLPRLKAMKYWVFVIGGAQLILTGIISYLVSYFLFNLDNKTSIVISLIIPLSSTAIVLKTLNKSGDINKKYGRRSFSILLMQDLAVVPILLIVGFLASGDKNLSSAIIDVIISGLILLILMFFIAKYLLEPFFNQVVKTSSDELFILTILFLSIGASYLAYVLGFSYSLGAFIAGMLIAETKYKHQIEADLVPFRDILLGLFFITVGMQINFNIIIDYFALILLILVLVSIVKFSIIYFLVRVRENQRISLKTALSILQIGEFSLAVLELTRTHGLLLENNSQIILMVIILSMIITPIILKNINNIVIFILKKDLTEVETFVPKIKNHIVLVGFGTLGKNIANTLSQNGVKYIIIENNVDTYHKAKEAKEWVVFGNASKKAVVQQANISLADFVIVAINAPDKLYATCHNLQKFIANDKIIIKLHTQAEVNLIQDLQLKNIIIENNLTSEKIMQFIT